MPRDGFSTLDFKTVAPTAPAKKTVWDSVDQDGDTDAADLKEKQSPAPPLSGPAARLAQLTTALTDLLKEETDFLHQRRTEDAKALHGPKNKLMAEYKTVVSQLKVNDRPLGPENSEQRVYIRKITDEMRDTLKEHARLVMRLKAVSEGLIKSIGEEVAKKNRPVSNYGASARVTPPRTMAPTSLALNQLI